MASYGAKATGKLTGLVLSSISRYFRNTHHSLDLSITGKSSTLFQACVTYASCRKTELRLTFQHQRTWTIVCISCDFYLSVRSFIRVMEKHKTGVYFWEPNVVFFVFFCSFFFFLFFSYMIKSTECVSISTFYG